jgi:hypothetical protein
LLVKALVMGLFEIGTAWKIQMDPLPKLLLPRGAPYTDYVSKNLTLSLNEDRLRAARKVAVDQNTSVNQMVRDYLEGLVRDADRKRALARLEEIFRTQQIEIGKRTLRRTNVHER